VSKAISNFGKIDISAEFSVTGIFVTDAAYSWFWDSCWAPATKGSKILEMTVKTITKRQLDREYIVFVCAL
jgi:hypothetical protein